MRNLSLPSADKFLALMLRYMEPSRTGDLKVQDIRIHQCEVKNAKACIMLEMPPPQGPTEAYLIALLHGTVRLPSRFGFGDPGQLWHYFTLERQVKMIPGSAPCRFCAWNEDAHANFGEGPDPTVESLVARLEECTGETAPRFFRWSPSSSKKRRRATPRRPEIERQPDSGDGPPGG